MELYVAATFFILSNPFNTPVCLKWRMAICVAQHVNASWIMVPLSTNYHGTPPLPDVWTLEVHCINEYLCVYLYKYICKHIHYIHIQQLEMINIIKYDTVLQWVFFFEKFAQKLSELYCVDILHHYHYLFFLSWNEFVCFTKASYAAIIEFPR